MLHPRDNGGVPEVHMLQHCGISELVWGMSLSLLAPPAQAENPQAGFAGPRLFLIQKEMIAGWEMKGLLPALLPRWLLGAPGGTLAELGT